MNQIKKEIRDIVYRDEDVLNGTLCFIGTRVPVSLILDYMGSGWSLSEIEQAYPMVKRAYIVKLIDSYSKELSSNVSFA